MIGFKKVEGGKNKKKLSKSFVDGLKSRKPKKVIKKECNLNDSLVRKQHLL